MTKLVNLTQASDQELLLKIKQNCDNLHYQLPEINAGYPTKKKRKQIAVEVIEKQKDYTLILKKHCSSKKKINTRSPVHSLKKLLPNFPSREIYNNIGIIKTLQALELKALSSEEYKYLKRFLYPLEIDNTSRLSQKVHEAETIPLKNKNH